MSELFPSQYLLILIAEIVENVANPPFVQLFRPDTAKLDSHEYIINCMKDCWEELPEARPDFKTVRARLKPLRDGM